MIFNVNNKKVNIDDNLVKKYKETMLENLSQEMIEYYFGVEAYAMGKNKKVCNEKDIKELIESAMKKDIALQEA